MNPQPQPYNVRRTVRRACVATASVVLLAAVAPPSHAQTSLDFARTGGATVTAFECAVLASQLERPLDQTRLFLHGLDRGKSFLAALRSGAIEQPDMNAHVPLAFVSVLQGPSPDFVLGRLYEVVQEGVLDAVLGPSAARHSADQQRALALDQFRQRRCAVLGTP